ncbi:MAG: hypothetical protein Q4D99_04485 [Bacillota bacterium]|nr:hypothetical protein [Bacillota bacterium]
MKKKMAKTLAVLMCIMTAVAFMPTFAFAADAEDQAEPATEQATEQQLEQPEEPQAEVQAEEQEEAVVEVEPAEDITVTVTVNNQGVLATDKSGKVMAYREVVASDIDEDGVITVDEALVAAHDTYLNGGAAENYDNGGGFASKVWGVATTNSAFFVNGTGLSTGVLVDTISNGDELYVSINKDNTYWADWYTAIYANGGEKIKTLRLATGEIHTIALKGCQGMAWPYDPTKPVQGVEVGIWEDGEFKSLPDGKRYTDEDGLADITFAKAGTYYVTAQGTVSDTVMDWSTYSQLTAECPIMAPVIKVTVYDDGFDTLAEAKADAVKTLSESFDINDYRSNVQLTLLAKVVAGISEINVADTPEKVSEALGKAFKSMSEIKTDAQMTKEENAVAAIGIASISVKAGKKKATVSWAGNEAFDGYQIYYKQSGKSAKYTTTTATSKTIKSLKKKKKVTFKVRGYKAMNGKTIYGQWSAARTVKIK